MARVPKVAREAILRGTRRSVEIRQICVNFSSMRNHWNLNSALHHDLILKMFYALFTTNRTIIGHFDKSEYYFLWLRLVLVGSTTIRLRTFRLRHFVYRHFVYRLFVYYCIPAYRTVIHPTSVSANHYFHQFQLLLTLWFLFINPTSTDTMIIQHTGIYLASIAAWESSLFFQLKMLILINPTSS